MLNMSFSEFMLSGIQKELSDNREFYYKLSEQSDKIIVWLVGFSIGSIALTISNENTLKAISNDLPTQIVIFSCGTIILGVLYRTLKYLSQLTENQILMNFNTCINVYKNPPDIPSLPPYRNLNGTESCEELRKYLKEDFDISDCKIESKDSSVEQNIAIQKSLTNYYNNTADRYNRYFEIEKNFVKNTLMNNLGYSQKEVDGIFCPVKPKINIHWIYRKSLFLSSLLFLMTTIVFMSGFAVFLWKYLER